MNLIHSACPSGVISLYPRCGTKGIPISRIVSYPPRLKGEIKMTSGFTLMITSLSKLPSIPILAVLPDFKRSFISLLNKCRVLVIPTTLSQASSLMKLDNCKEVMQMALRTGVSITV